MGRGQHLLIASAIVVVSVNSDCINDPERGPDGVALCRASDFGQGESRRLMGPPAGKAKPPAGSNITFSIWVRPKLQMWSGLDFAGGFVGGIFALEQSWSADVDAVLRASDAAEIVRVENFLGGTTGIVTEPILYFTHKGKDYYEVQRQVEGQFKQSFDSTCYPFDHQTSHFKVVIHLPVAKYFNMHLLCENADGVVGTDSTGNSVANPSGGEEPWSLTDIQTCTKPLGKSYSGYSWDTITCKKKSNSELECKMEGHHTYGKILTNFVAPSIMVSMMSFASFALHVSMSMPRIATTVIAMLTLNNLKAALSKNLPGGGDLSWMEEYLFFGTIFMFINLCCHISSMRVHRLGYVNLSDFIDDIGCGISFSLFLSLPFISILARGCTEEGISAEGAGIVVAVGMLLLFVLIIKAVVTKRAAFSAWMASRGKAKADSPPQKAPEPPRAPEVPPPQPTPTQTPPEASSPSPPQTTDV